MKIVRYFIHDENENTGLIGFVPLWIPRDAGFDPIGVRGMVHDMLEHRLADTGLFHEEVMAFGRMMALRGLPGVLNTYMRESWSRLLGRELASAYRDVENSGADDPLRAAPRTGTLDDSDFKAELHEVVAGFRQSCLDEAEYEECYEPPGQSVLDRLANWLKIGYMDALRRYGGSSACCDIGWSAFSWANQNENRLQRIESDCKDGDSAVLRLAYDTDTNRMTERLIEPSRETGEYPQWLRLRIRDWRCRRVALR